MTTTERPDMIRVEMRWVDLHQDLLRVVNIDRLADPELSWSADQWQDFIRRRPTLTWKGCFPDGFMVAVVAVELHRKHLRIHKFCVHPQWRRRQIGWQLLQRLKVRLRDVGEQQELRIRVRDDNLSAHLFLKALDFRAREVLKAWDDVNDWYEFKWHVRDFRVQERE